MLERLTKRFGTVLALDRVSLEVPSGSFVTFLGPSGSGKTTTLNVIAGFLEPDEGEVFIDGRPISRTPTHRRDLGMVFQSYALFPHMTVFDNVAFPLRMRTRLPKMELERAVEAALALVHLAGLGGRYPRQLSGGQQQRVATARALVSRPRLLLMDEPLGALDKKLREQMQVEMKSIHRAVGSTFLYVTHDQEEALAMSDVVVVMRDGRIEQVGSPRDLYAAPASEFVADFLGSANLLPGRVVGREGDAALLALDGGTRLRVPHDPDGPAAGAAVKLLVRPEDVEVHLGDRADGGRQTVPGKVSEIIYLGEMTRVVVDTAEGVIVARLAGRRGGELALGHAVAVSWPPTAVRLLPASPGS
ncbi:MAG TPA: ABC transporter ATP-binding protein [Candidatus Bathyarchaeia archaeon]|nr:ABC transporter ATP-binding protein [Candidatus Bathyarchaeia archaeon]